MEQQRYKGLLLASHELRLDPRFTWLSETFGPQYEIYQIGISHHLGDQLFSVDDSHSRVKKIELNCAANILRLEQQLTVWDSLPLDLKNFFLELNEIKQRYLANVSDISGSQKLFNFIGYHVALVTNVICNIAVRMTDMDLIIACDCDTLLAGAIIASRLNVPLIYDAHEYWAEAWIDFDDTEKQFWMQYEKHLVQRYVNLPMTVSPQLAAFFTKAYKKEYLSIPNAELVHKQIPAEPQNLNKFSTSDGICVFLYQGGFALYRGLEKIITLWQKTSKNCHLYLRGIKNDYSNDLKKQAKKTGLLNRRIFFLEPVAEAQLIHASKQADVGLIPYEPQVSLNHLYCCPNKLSQFLAAGIPILANDLTFVKQILMVSEAGISVDFDDEAAFLSAVKQLSENKQYREQSGLNARQYFLNYFNWETLSENFYKSASKLLPGNPKVKQNTVAYLLMLALYFQNNHQDEILGHYKRVNFSVKFISVVKTVVFEYLLIGMSKEKKQSIKTKLKAILAR